MPCLTY